MERSMTEYVEHIITIWAPRWHDRTVLVGKHRVKKGMNYIKFNQAPSLPSLYHMHSDQMKCYPLESNGKIMCYAVPLDDLTIEGEMF